MADLDDRTDLDDVVTDDVVTDDVVTDDPVLQVMSLGAPPWPTLDPFLFCVHHDDAYPAANGAFGPDTVLAGRQLGNDFAGRDGWRMYHGETVPGFPSHPHRGFETVTFVRRGLVDHADSLGAAARYGEGDAQWLTAGGGIVHSEMFPLVDDSGPNPLELFQLWLNLPAADKLVEPHFTMLWAEDLPRVAVGRPGGPSTEVTVVAGAFGDHVPPPPPPRSWAAHPESDVAIWHVRLAPGASCLLPPAAGADTVRTLYLFDGGAVQIGGREVASSHGVVVRGDVDLALSATDGADVLVLQGRPIGEPVTQHGPFVMNDRAGIEQAFEDYRTTGFGGWPWPTADPVHGADPARFARHADGRTERPGT